MHFPKIKSMIVASMSTRIFDSIKEIPQADWNKLAPKSFPFMSYNYLSALEESGSLGDRTGWRPIYITLYEHDELIGAFPCFRKSNSYGEYIFDFAWAQAYQSNGLPYYPKLVSAVPFTPATGPKILLSPHAPPSTAHELLRAAELLARETKMSSVHALFISEKEIPSFQAADYEIRHSYQFHWRNQNYKSFEDFLSKLKSKRRKEITRERRQVEAANLKISILTGEELKAEHCQIMYQFYLDTTSKMGGHSYLTKAFFENVFKNMKDQIAFVLAQDQDGRPVAGALNYFTEESLYGRYWGCLADYKSLHFEVCYYQLIDFAIQRKLKLFEAGAQGEHKFQRGFLPSLTYSAHKIFDKRFGSAIANFISEEREQIGLIFQEYETHNPFAEKSS